ncbi:MAG: FG-GAP-like repeat-containing protein [Candidatus Eisenbacteria bacterium]
MNFGGTQYRVAVLSDMLRNIQVADLDGDGDLDLISGSYASAAFELVAWENDGTPFWNHWPRHYIGGTTHDVCSIGITDLDHDNDLDIVTGCGTDVSSSYPIIAWERTGPWSWTPHEVGTLTCKVVAIRVADLDGDSFFDIVSLGCEYSGETRNVVVWQNDGTPFSGAWTSNTVFSGYALGPGLAVGDLDNDGDDDVACGGNEYYIYALQNDGTPFSGAWQSNYVGSACGGMVGYVEMAFLDGDAYRDIVTTCGYTPSYTQSIFRNDGTPFSGSWPSNVIGSVSAPTGGVGDFDLDGDTDIMTGCNKGDLFIWENDGTPFSGSWGSYLVGSACPNIISAQAADVDGDGDKDIVAANGYAAGCHRISLWKNMARTLGERRATDSDPAFKARETTVDDVTGPLGAAPADVALCAAIPNPSVGGVQISFHVPAAGPVLVTVHDVRGMIVREVANDRRDAGYYSLLWDGKNARGEEVTGGIYFVTLEATGKVLRDKLVLVR